MSLASAWPETRAAAASERGSHRRRNQDAFALLPEQRLFLLSDGMGGRSSGDVASWIVVGEIPRLLSQKLEVANQMPAEEIGRKLTEVVAELSDRIREEAAKHPTLDGMGATLVALLLDGCNAHIVHLGDSRAYLLREGRLSRLTEDHNIGAVLVKLREVAPEDLEALPSLKGLSRYAGMDGQVCPDVQAIPLRPGDRFLLCSDGLTGVLGDNRIAVLLNAAAGPQETCDGLVAAAKAAGDGDDITVMVVDVLTVAS